MSEDHDEAEQAEEDQAERLEAEKAERLARDEIGIDISQDPVLEPDDEDS